MPISGDSSESLACGVSEPPLLETTIGAHLDASAQRWPQREALVVCHQHVRWTYSELRSRVNAVAARLLALGLQPGDRVGIWSQNCAEWVLTQFATAKAGLILVNINPAYRKHELEYALNKVGCRALILSQSFKTSDYLAMLEAIAPELPDSVPGALNAMRLPELRIVIRIGEEERPGVLGFANLLQEPDAEAKAYLEIVAARVNPGSAINIQFTSGTTGAPKGAALTHRNILNNGYFVGRAMRFTEQDRLCIPVPLYHCFGMVLGTLACVAYGACMVLPGEGFDAETVLKTVQDERCTALHGVPTMFIALLDHPQFGSYDYSSLRTGVMAGAPCPIEVMRKVIDRLHMAEVTIGYGMTETSPISFQSSFDDPLERRVSTVGRVHPHVEVKVVNDDGHIVPRGQKGELMTRGYSVMLGYWNDPQATLKSIDAEGWMRTGDLGAIDDEGYCNILGRVKDMVIRGGENIYPREVEEFLYRHPKIRDVQCVGVPDERFGEELCACVLLYPGATLTAEELRSFCQGEIAHYKIPRYVRVLDAFPMTVTGKIQKFALRDQIAAELGLQEARTA